MSPWPSRLALLVATALCSRATSCDDPGHLVTSRDGAVDQGVKLLDGPPPGDTVKPDKPKQQPPDKGTDKPKPPPDKGADKPKPPPDKGTDKPKPPDKPKLPCPADMVAIQTFCMDRYEAPNTPAALPLVMYHYNEALAWCQARGKRLCYDDEWTLACSGAAGSTGTKYPYGNTHKPGVCNDNKTWKLYVQSKLSGWPSGASGPNVMSLTALWTAAKAKGSKATVAADHVKWLYQGDLSGAKTGCVSVFGVHDLCGNVEEWTTRRDGGKQYFHGNLKGRYWSETRTCQSNIKSHGDSFRFYEIGFRCCRDQTP
jgi:hypothetical protein